MGVKASYVAVVIVVVGVDASLIPMNGLLGLNRRGAFMWVGSIIHLLHSCPQGGRGGVAYIGMALTLKASLSVLCLPLLTLPLPLIILVSHFFSSWHKWQNSHYSKLGYDPGLSCSVGFHVRWIDAPLDLVLHHTTMMEDHRQPFRNLRRGSTSWHKHRGTNYFPWLTDLVLMRSVQLRIRQRKQKVWSPIQMTLRSSVIVFRKHEMLRIHSPVALITRVPLTNRIGAQCEIYHFTTVARLHRPIKPSVHEYSQIIARQYEQIRP